MRKLHRGQTPNCLSKYRHGSDEWREISKNTQCSAEIWQQIEDMQGSFCAYCESHFNNKKHIEHFFRRRDLPQRTFDWTNLFGSCNEPSSCGGYKDNHAPSSIDLSKVCKPDENDPADYLLFVENGNVVPKEGLSTEDIQIAENTIQIFNLNGSTKLVGKRREAARRELESAKSYFEVANDYAGSDDLDMKDLLENELKDNLARIEKEEHSVVLKQIWEL